MIHTKILLCNELNGVMLSRAASWLSSLRTLLVPSLPSASLDTLENPPPKGPLTLRNAYIPLNRAFLFRELIQDTSVIVPSDRDNFEQIVLSMQKRFSAQFRILEREMSLLFQPVLSESPEHLEHSTRFVSPDMEGSALRPLTDSEKRDREFWILRRLAQLADAAGFMEVPRDQLEHAFHAKQFSHEVASVFVNPKDYDVIRFWIRGIHPRTVKTISAVPPSDSSGGLLHLIGKYILRPSLQLPRTLQRLRRGSAASAVSTSQAKPKLNTNPSRPPDLRFTNVLMAVRGPKENELLLKLYDSAPAAKPSRQSNYTDRLALLMPVVHFRPLTPAGRSLIAASCLTAFTCLGLVAPFAWLVTANPELVFAWSVAASATAGLTASLVWARYWRSRARISAQLKNLQFHCARNSGFQSVQNLIQIAVDEELKAAVLAYALLLQPSESGPPLGRIGLGIRAETWISKRLTPKAHVPTAAPPDSTFLGGSGPLFDVVFEPDRALELLRRLGLVRGPHDSPQAIPTTAARDALDTNSGTKSGLSSVWVLDPILGDDFTPNRLD